MDRSLLVRLFLSGMKCQRPNRRLWLTRCFEIKQRADQVIEVDEYEGTSLSDACHVQMDEMTRVGRSTVDLTTGKVTDHPSKGALKKMSRALKLPNP